MLAVEAATTPGMNIGVVTRSVSSRSLVGAIVAIQEGTSTMDSNMDKKIVDGKVAVLVSPGYGAGWYSWNLNHPGLLFDPVIVDMVLENRHNEIEDYVTRRCEESGIDANEVYCGGSGDLVVRWVEQGKIFRIHEYDGSESLVLQENDDWIVA
jgi:hypothetical protein